MDTNVKMLDNLIRDIEGEPVDKDKDKDKDSEDDVVQPIKRRGSRRKT